MQIAWAIAAASVAALAYLPLITAILTGRAREERLSWIIWAAQYALLFAVQGGRGGGPLLALIGAGTVGCLLTCALTLWRGTGRCSPARIAVLVGTLAALAAWRCTRDPSVAFGLLVAVEAAATIATIRNAYRTGAEPVAYWLLIALAALLEIPGARTWPLSFAAVLRLHRHRCCGRDRGPGRHHDRSAPPGHTLGRSQHGSKDVACCSHMPF